MLTFSHRCLWFPEQEWLFREETWLAGLQQQQDHVAEKELKACVPPGAWLQADPETPLSPLVRSQKREVRLQFGCRKVLRAARRDIRRRKAFFQLERIISKQRLLEAQKGLERPTALCWIQDDCTQKPPHQVPSTDAMVPGPQRGSRRTGCSSLSLRRLCSLYFPHLHRYSQQWSPEIIDRGLQPCCSGGVLYFPGPQFLSLKWKDLPTPLFPTTFPTSFFFFFPYLFPLLTTLLSLR